MPKFIFDDIVTDSRKITQGSLFVALKGEKFNGEDFAKEAITKGAAGVIVAEGKDVFCVFGSCDAHGRGRGLLRPV